MYSNESKKWYKYDYNQDGDLELMEDTDNVSINIIPKTDDEINDILNAIDFGETGGGE